MDKSQLISHILKTEQLHPDESIMIGDRKYDIIGARNNALKPYGVSYGFGSADELQDAEHIFSAPIKIASYFLRS